VQGAIDAGAACGEVVSVVKICVGKDQLGIIAEGSAHNLQKFVSYKCLDRWELLGQVSSQVVRADCNTSSEGDVVDGDRMP